MTNILVLAIMLMALIYLVYHFVKQIRGISKNTSRCSETCRECRNDASTCKFPSCH